MYQFDACRRINFANKFQRTVGPRPLPPSHPILSASVQPLHARLPLLRIYAVERNFPAVEHRFGFSSRVLQLGDTFQFVSRIEFGELDAASVAVVIE